jgi:hypothetical protein
MPAYIRKTRNRSAYREYPQTIGIFLGHLRAKRQNQESQKSEKRSTPQKNLRQDAASRPPMPSQSARAPTEAVKLLPYTGSDSWVEGVLGNDRADELVQ